MTSHGTGSAAARDFEALEAEIRGEFRTFRLIAKERSFLMRAIFYGLGVWLFCPRFMTSYTTVIISWVYMPADLIGTRQGCSVLRHERVHMRDCFRTGIVPFVLSYLFVLPSVLTVRSYWEMRGYEETMRAERDLSGTVSDATLDRIQGQFTSSAYLWMCPFPSLVRRWLERVRERVLAEAPRSG